MHTYILNYVTYVIDIEITYTYTPICIKREIEDWLLGKTVFIESVTVSQMHAMKSAICLLLAK